MVRAEPVSGRKSSKRVQTGEPLLQFSHHAISLIPLRAFQAFLLDRPHSTVTPAWTRTFIRRSSSESIRRLPAMRANFRMDHPDGTTSISQNWTEGY